ncbi:unnamed protein product [Caenorhabditis sp. 36 PRJEB53466]|nr:unnamed protein product [Caenorhabditis sp. 36 PRJEB53466]
MGAGAEASGDGPAGSTGSSSGGGGPSLTGNIFGNTCFKACGMEDIQFAARAAGEMFSTIKMCVLMSTIISLLLLVLLSAAFFYFMCSYNQNCANCSKFSLPSFFKRVTSTQSPMTAQK